jgi:DUF438 domain-containing protein
MLFLQEIQKKYRLIIDNITPENIVPMAKHMISLPMKTEDVRTFISEGV